MIYKVLGKKGKELHTSMLLHPGEIVEDELTAREIKKATFAESLGIKPSHLSELLKGKRHVSAFTAIKLEQLLGISAEYWLRVQMNYDLQIARYKLSTAA
jgi:HTH-type transcriptional regulator/antitoxin HigA